ncbi:MAG: DUF488 family protein [Sphaerochaeta sp.]|jgi:uncharacterized protein YeaO (DUF488 family)|nr:DUF488 family protein [Sphaerochaeta sp.]
MEVKVQRIYEATETQGYRILVDRLWPRGISKEKARLDAWEKEIAPSDSLRQWFSHDVERYDEFRRRYQAELDANPKVNAFLTLVRNALSSHDVILLFAAKDPLHNNAAVLREYLASHLQPIPANLQ